MAVGNKEGWEGGHLLSMALSSAVGSEGMEALLSGEKSWDSPSRVPTAKASSRVVRDLAPSSLPPPTRRRPPSCWWTSSPPRNTPSGRSRTCTTGGGPAGARDVLGTVAYTSAFQLNRIGYGTTVVLVVTALAIPFAVWLDRVQAGSREDGRMTVQETAQPTGRPDAGTPRRAEKPCAGTGGTRQHLLVTVLAVFTLFPVVLTVSTTLKTSEDVQVNPFGLSTSFSRENLVTAFTVGRFGEYLLDSILLTVPSTLLVVVLSRMAGHAFARLPFPGRTPASYLVVLGLLVPFSAYMIPLYFQLRSMGLLDGLVGVDLVLASTQQSFGTWCRW